MASKILRGLGKFHSILSYNSSTNKFKYVGAGLLATSLAVYSAGKITDVHAAQIDPIFKKFLAEPITSRDHLKKNHKDMKSKMEILIMKIQADFVEALESFEDEDIKFKVDRWERKEGGGGITCILQDGTVFEKAGVNISVVTGNLPPSAVQQMRARGKQMDEGSLPFFAAGVSAVIHPRNPMVFWFILLCNVVINDYKYFVSF